jgi:hypothetical protein
LNKNYVVWEDNIKVGISEIGWIQLAEDRDWWQAFLKMITNLSVP